MKNELRPSRAAFAVVQTLQDQMSVLPAGSYASRVAEKGIEYALSDRRSSGAPAFLLHDVYRNARTAIRREDQRRSVLDVLEAHDRLRFALDPAESVLASSLNESIARCVRSALGPIGLAVYDSLLADEPPSETAARLGLSRRTIERYRERAKTQARTVVMTQAA